MEQISFEQLNRIDLVDFLATIGIQPKKRKDHRYYYLSPLAGHPIHRPTFIVDRHRNRWRETSTRQTGVLADLAVRLYDCTIGELTGILRSTLPPVQQIHATKGSNGIPLVALHQTHSIRSTYLERFLWERRIPLLVARQYCLEAWYHRKDQLYHALAFRNDAGGWELFDSNRHYRVAPGGPTLISHQSASVAIFRHVLDQLSYVALFSDPIHQLPDLLILNAPIPFPAVQAMIQSYRHIHLFLPNDATGIAFSIQAAQSLTNCYDHRSLYEGYPTLNDWNCRIGTAPGYRIAPYPLPPLPNPPPMPNSR
ncbi:MAG TPA: hypothetical protein VGM30_19680 [Puia sp.]|jgi:hypothetical protein